MAHSPSIKFFKQKLKQVMRKAKTEALIRAQSQSVEPVKELLIG
jgi:hypothetical protein